MVFVMVMCYNYFSNVVKVVSCAFAIPTIAVAHIVNAAMAVSQADYNKSDDKREIVSDQYEVNMKLGCKTVVKFGCGAVAAHNAIILAGGSSSLAEVVEFMQAHDLTFGVAGVYFTNIQLYLKRKGYSNRVCLTGLKGNLDKKIKNCRRKIAILAYKHPTNFHYVAIKYDTSENKFKMYNNDEIVDSVDTWFKEKGNGYYPLCLITL